MVEHDKSGSKRQELRSNMRNLITLNKGKFKPTASTAEGDEDDLSFTLLDSVFDTLSDSITCVLGSTDIGAIEVQQFMKDGSRNVLASFNIQTFDDKLLSFVHFADINQLVFVFEQGDIITATYDPVSLDPAETLIEIMGTIDNGIAAAQWSYDEETLAMVTKDRNVVVLSKLYEPISEYHLEVDDLKISKHVTVGWGKKETQFRGKGARAMEREALASLKASGLVGNQLRDPTMPYMVDTGDVTALDSHEITISWRGDCDYFAVSSVEEVPDEDDETKSIKRRAFRVFSREGQLDSASEPVTGMEHQLSWKPQGSLIASIQRKTDLGEEDSVDVIFFERNGLRHGEFDTRLPLDEKVESVCWNSNSEALAVVLANRIQLWTSKNYHWYLKQELYGNDISYVKWHPEKDFTLMFSDAGFINIVDFAYKMAQGPTLEPFDNGTSLVVDGRTVNITPLAHANVPPPMYYRDFETPGNVLDVACSFSNEIYAAINKDVLIFAAVPSIEEMKKGKHPSIVCEFPKSEFTSEVDSLRQVAFINDSIVGVLLDTDNLSRIALVDIQDITQPTLITIVEVYDKIVLLRSDFDYNHLVYETRDGTVCQLDAEGQLMEITKFPQLVPDFRVKRVHNTSAEDDGNWSAESSELVAFGITNNGKLFANQVLLASAVTSLEITDSFLLFTTAQHNLQFVHLNSTDFKPLPLVEEGVEDERVRAIERGSILVSVIPSKSSVVLQATRGNLETIYPRIMVLAEVRKNIMAKRYKEAFIVCRTHRINLDILHDYAPELFIENLEVFINQIGRVDYLNLFISCLSEDDVTKTKYKETLYSGISKSFGMEPAPLTEMQIYMKKKMFDPKTSKVNKICDAVLNVLLSNPEYKKKYLQTIITAYASQNPQNLSAALKLISELENSEEKDSCVTYLCFLQDVNVVYKSALSLYDVSLALLVAQKSQMDPREYLPFLQELQDNEPLRRKFLIDDYLGNYEKALEHLSEIDKDGNVSEEVIDYVESHDLYKHGLALYRYDSEKQNVIYNIYAKHLSSNQMYTDAAVAYEMLGKFKEAMGAYQSAKRWREAMSIAVQKFPEEVESVAEELISSLTFEHRYVDAADIQLEYLDNVKEAVALYCKAYRYDIASLVAIKAKKDELLEEVVDPGLGEGFGIIAELLADCKGQINSQLRRLRELRAKKEENPYAFYGQETEQADDVSVAPSETSTQESFFTRYTGKTGGTAKTGASRRTAKNKRREERKRARGKKGTIYEEEYLVQSVGRLIERLNQTKPDAVRVVEGLCRRNMREQAHQIQKNFVEVLDLLKANVKEIYSISEKDRERVNENGEVYYIPEIPVPEIHDFPKSHIVDF
ncbi:APG_G0038810.mRNA.1.CDS.1 [Saccharomyces cerevisiae]|uniref:Elongator complex protein 1 n=1 Tax=Saccharomyces cerevisiae (strain JAY291) TaxID=574961 RepID=C7GXI8_YEAS2|nr:Iki3p [Saccharomyces cerevisiae JAY291]CAE6510165.1 Elongator subunit IKI3 [Saccharomyces cerevisiae PE-2]CAI4644288.1 BCN_G0039310.mRNA.1.CDS.1 [Saccharomyces cerevisiae]CAF1594177.1 Elongator subunit IKI3 [Saccharomyces cerevisiae PE-2]CAI4669275.1 BCE_3a_G0039320.mRNA.1.CDS.1 [Saccharomyces cerevisiae]